MLLNHTDDIQIVCTDTQNAANPKRRAAIHADKTDLEEHQMVKAS